MLSPRLRYGTSTILGIALIASYFTIRPGDFAPLIIGTGFALYGLAAGTLAEFILGPNGLLMRWQEDFANAVAETVKAAIASTAPAAQSEAHATYIPPKNGDPS